jgi:hypothetical protein
MAEMLSNIGFAALVIRTGRRIAAEDEHLALTDDFTS